MKNVPKFRTWFFSHRHFRGVFFFLNEGFFFRGKFKYGTIGHLIIGRGGIIAKKYRNLNSDFAINCGYSVNYPAPIITSPRVRFFFLGHPV